MIRSAHRYKTSHSFSSCRGGGRGSAAGNGLVHASSLMGSAANKWWKLASNLPCHNSTVDRAARKKMFKSMDTNGNGLLSQREIDDCLQKALGGGDTGASW